MMSEVWERAYVAIKSSKTLLLTGQVYSLEFRRLQAALLFEPLPNQLILGGAYAHEFAEERKQGPQKLTLVRSENIEQEFMEKLGAPVLLYNRGQVGEPPSWAEYRPNCEPTAALDIYHLAKVLEQLDLIPQHELSPEEPAYLVREDCFVNPEQKQRIVVYYDPIRQAICNYPICGKSYFWLYFLALAHGLLAATEPGGRRSYWSSRNQAEASYLAELISYALPFSNSDEAKYLGDFLPIDEAFYREAWGNQTMVERQQHLLRLLGLARLAVQAIQKDLDQREEVRA